MVDHGVAGEAHPRRRELVVHRRQALEVGDERGGVLVPQSVVEPERHEGEDAPPVRPQAVADGVVPVGVGVPAPHAAAATGQVGRHDQAGGDVQEHLAGEVLAVALLARVHLHHVPAALHRGRLRGDRRERGRRHVVGAAQLRLPDGVHHARRDRQQPRQRAQPDADPLQPLSHALILGRGGRGRSPPVRRTARRCTARAGPFARARGGCRCLSVFYLAGCGGMGAAAIWRPTGTRPGQRWGGGVPTRGRGRSPARRGRTFRPVGGSVVRSPPEPLSGCFFSLQVGVPCFDLHWAASARSGCWKASRSSSSSASPCR